MLSRPISGVCESFPSGKTSLLLVTRKRCKISLTMTVAYYTRGQTAHDKLSKTKSDVDLSRRVRLCPEKLSLTDRELNCPGCLPTWDADPELLPRPDMLG